MFAMDLYYTHTFRELTKLFLGFIPIHHIVLVFLQDVVVVVEVMSPASQPTLSVNNKLKATSVRILTTTISSYRILEVFYS